MIVIDKLWPLFVETQDYTQITKHGIHLSSEVDTAALQANGFFVSWGERPKSGRHAIIETGFFSKGLHIDSHGLYDRALFNYPSARPIIERFEAPRDWKELYKLGVISSKFPQASSKHSWKGVVVICQHPTDRSVMRAGGPQEYYRFIEKVCKKFGSQVLLKRHPVTLGNQQDAKILNDIAVQYGSTLANVNASVIDDAQAVYVFNSTFVVDALMKGKKVLQYAPGYFWQSGVVQYTNREIVMDFQLANADYVSKFINFLLWKYCFHGALAIDKIAEIVKLYATSNDPFPLPPELSYGAFVCPR